jgi:hypothetical protein
VHEMSSNFQSACMYVTYTTNEQKMYETWGFHGSEDLDHGLLDFDTI